MANQSKPQQGMNDVTLLGNVKGRPEIVDAADDGKVLPVKLSCIRRVLVDETWTDRPEEVRIVVFGKRAKSLASMNNGEGLRDGDRLLVKGRLADGKRGHYVHADDVILCGGRKRDAGGDSGRSSDGGGARDDDEIPF